MKTSKLDCHSASTASITFLSNIKSCKIIILTSVMLLLAFTSVGSAATLNVDGVSYSTIQGAVDAANNGDTILVSPGTYTENVVVDKPLVIQSTGGAEVTKVVAAASDVDVIDITADGVTISGFTVSGATVGDKYLNTKVTGGIRLHSAGNTVSDIIATNNFCGISLTYSGSNTLTNNVASDNDYGIYLDHSENTIMRDNIMTGNSRNFGAEGPEYMDNDIDTSNTVDGKPIYYILDESDVVLDSTSNAGTIYAIRCDNILVKDLTFSNTWHGVYFQQTENSKIENTNCVDSRYGLSVWYYSDYNTVTGNTGSDTEYVITLHREAENNLISNNEVTNGIAYGIQIYSSNNMVVGNTVSDSWYGLAFSGTNITGQDNTLLNNIYGFYLSTANDNTISSNTITGSDYYGLYLKTSNGNDVSGNTVTSGDYSIKVSDSSSDNLIYNNYLENSVLLDDTLSGNSWNIEKTAGTNIAGGPYLGGNFWAKTDGTGFSQTEVDSTGDGICESSYTLDSDNIDHLPLVLVTGTTNSAPVATIDSITPESTNLGESVTFTGSGTDADGTIAAYKWESDRDGELSSEASFSTSDLSAGTHAISFSVQDDDGDWSAVASSTVTIVDNSNTAPVAAIDSISPETATSGESVTFTGSGNDTDGTIAAYKWVSDLDGELSSDASFSTSSLTVGTHTISFSVQDNAGAWSEVVTSSVTISETPNEIPTANIISISPNPVVEGNSVYFAGSGSDTDGTIAAYNWTSSIDGQLSTSANFSTADLSAGDHTISLIVQDDDGDWSEEVSSELTINEAPAQDGTNSTVPVLINVTPSSGSSLDDDTTSVDVIFNYNDTDAGVDTNSVVFIFDYLDVSDDAGITSTSATYSATGLSAGSTHIASVYVVDNEGNAATFTTTFTIDEKSSSGSSSGSSSSSSSHSSSSGGSGGGTTGEQYANILVKEVKSIYLINGAHINYEFSKEGNAISSVQFDSLKNSGSTQAIVEVLKARSSFADSDAPGEIYQQMNIWVGKSGFARADNIENMIITFKVEKSWITENNIDADNVMLYRYADNAWNTLPTTVTGEDADYTYFETETQGFSPFAIASEPVPEEEVVVEEEMMSVDDNNTESLAEVQSAEAKTTLAEISSTSAGALIIGGALVILVIGGFVMYRKRS